MTDRQIKKLSSLATEVTFAENEVILQDRHQSQYFYLVTAGTVTVELYTASFAVSLVPVGPGEAFGWSALLDLCETVFQVRAREQTTALRIPGPELRAACQADPDFGLAILQRTLYIVASRIRATEARFAEMCSGRLEWPDLNRPTERKEKEKTLLP